MEARLKGKIGEVEKERVRDRWWYETAEEEWNSEKEGLEAEIRSPKQQVQTLQQQQHSTEHSSPLLKYTAGEEVANRTSRPSVYLRSDHRANGVSRTYSEDPPSALSLPLQVQPSTHSPSSQQLSLSVQRLSPSSSASSSSASSSSASSSSASSTSASSSSSSSTSFG
ncbi:uncharacterized protein MONOS_347 [Monocercomonoides exilis]|uniref:uncharacterized protein n=1 Tax=Monocercomonoides exilis TaxID=2049356 RepID=UPI00355951E3|nr:hypothetical protein MONOS_347 [Monocercomonoides exilis]|eukprot:MONOS_347.1-p1 / transcript=MONOS_347.1 / gene=MONOS_347 / organism=Monocercomonoides_exilis_PA203 / gene_product=unspecified product / transcript_product=unspecified product / location=Mono_scaffold00005:308509-309012(-) / protein_length=168 / sequence_SO=supercontig / SO=protein_coding / is_pseudo=false